VAVTAPINALRRASAVLLDSADPAAWRVAQAIDAWLNQGGDFASALGMATNWHSALRLRQRDAALRELALVHFASLRGDPRARAMVAAAADYEARRWPRDRASWRRPDGRDGLFFDVLSQGRMPGREMLRKCFGSERSGEYQAVAE
jgi:hypothetical protein